MPRMAWMTAFLVVAAIVAAGFGSGWLESDPGEDPSPPVGVTGGDGAGETVRPDPGEDVAWADAPVLPDLSGPAGDRLRREVARADRAGMRAGVFAKVGDSNTDYAQNLYGLGCREVDLGDHGNLAPVLARYRRATFPGLATYPDCEPANSFSRDSAAAVSGVWAEWVITPLRDLPENPLIPPPAECRPRQTPLGCEISLLRPRYTFVMIGANDVLQGMPLGETLAGHLDRIIVGVRASGSVPLLVTQAPMDVITHGGESGNDRIAEANEIIWQLAGRRGVPLVNLWRALVAPGMIGNGLGDDRLHLGAYGGESSPDVLENSAVLTEEALRHGANRRQLIWLQALARLDRAAAG